MVRAVMEVGVMVDACSSCERARCWFKRKYLDIYRHEYVCVCVYVCVLFTDTIVKSMMVLKRVKVMCARAECVSCIVFLSRC